MHMKQLLLGMTSMILLTLGMIFASFMIAWPWCLAVLLILAILLALIASAVLPEEWFDPAWQLTGKALRKGEIPPVIIDESLLRGTDRLVADARVPFAAVPPERFRAQSGAMIFSAAAALADTKLPDSAYASLNIQADNFATRFPVQDTLTLNGLTGIVVRDGNAQRAYFASDASLANACTQVLDNRERPMQDADRKRVIHLPGLHYATAVVHDGKPGALTYLGSVETRPVPTMSAEAHTALTHLSAAGYAVKYTGAGTLARKAGIAPAAEGDAGLWVEPLASESKRFDLPVLSWSRHQEAQHALRLRMVFVCVLLILLGALMTAAPAAAVSVLLACYLMSRRIDHLRADKPVRLILSALLALLIGGIFSLFLHQIGAGSDICCLLLAAWACVWAAMPDLDRAGERRGSLLVRFVLLAAAGAAVYLFAPLTLTLTEAGFGLCAGLLGGLVSWLPLRQD